MSPENFDQVMHERDNLRIGNARLREALDRAVKDMVQIAGVMADLDNEVFHSSLFHEECKDPRMQDIKRARKTLGHYLPSLSDMCGFLNKSDEEKAQMDKDIIAKLIERAALKGES